MKRVALAAITLLATVGIAGAQANPTGIMSSESGFDVSNQSGKSCDGFEIDLAGIAPADVFHTYRNKDFGAPEVVADSGDTKIVYKGHKTEAEAIEHFGVSLSAAPSSVKYRWKDGGQDCGGAAGDVELPNEAENVSGDSVGTDVRNDSPDGQPIWVQRRVTTDNRAVALEELKTDNPAYTDGAEIDAAPEKLEHGATISHDDALDPEDTIESVIEATDVYADNNGQPGKLIGTVINAAVLNPSGVAACVNNLASLKLNPNHGKGGVVRPLGVVRLTSAAPTGGEIVLLSSDTPGAASVPTSVTVPAGAKAVNFRVITHSVTEPETVGITATCGSIDREAQLALRK